MRSRKYQGGFLNFLLPAIATVGAALIGSKGQRDTNETNAELSRETMAFNREEAEKTRTWSAEQAATTREFNADEARIFREYSSGEAGTNRDFQSAEADKQRAWSEHMSGTSYQRAIGDLERSGLNPMLAYSQGGAPMPTSSVPSGSMGAGSAASASVPSGATASSSGFHPRMSTAIAGLNAAAAVAQIGNINADTKLKEAQVTRETSSALNLQMGTLKLQEEIPKIKHEVDLLWKQIRTEDSRRMALDAQELLDRAKAKLASGELDKVAAETAFTQIRTKLEELRLPEAEAYSEKFKGFWGAHVSPYLGEILEILKALVGIGGMRGIR